jgi:hypothetical protein
MEMPKPHDAHAKLQRLVGEWTGDEHMHPSPWDPKGGMAIGRVHNRLALDGFAVLQDYEQERNGNVTYRGHGVFTWDQAEKVYLLYWFDSIGSPLNTFKGSFTDRVLTLVSTGPQGQVRATFDFTKEGSYSYRMDVSPDGSAWSIFVEATYTRKP